MAARRPHKPKAVGSIPAPAIMGPILIFKNGFDNGIVDEP